MQQNRNNLFPKLFDSLKLSRPHQNSPFLELARILIGLYIPQHWPFVLYRRNILVIVAHQNKADRTPPNQTIYQAVAACIPCNQYSIFPRSFIRFFPLCLYLISNRFRIILTVFLAPVFDACCPVFPRMCLFDPLDRFLYRWLAWLIQLVCRLRSGESALRAWACGKQVFLSCFFWFFVCIENET